MYVMNPIVKITMVRIIGQNSVTMAQMRNATTAKKSDYTLYTYFSHNPMRRHCQFTVKRFEVNYSNMGLEHAPSCMVLSRSMNRGRLN